MTNAEDDIISQKKFLNKLRKVEFHLRCLEDSRQAAQQDAMEEFCDIGSNDDKIKSYQKLVNLGEYMEKTEIASEECIMLDLSSQYISQLQLEALRLGLVKNRLNEENDWLAKTNRGLKSRIQQLQSKINTADADMQQYLLMCQIRQTDTFKTESKLIGASIERDLEINRNVMLHLSSQFKAFYPLALQYINSGRYEVAISLCKQSKGERKLKNADEAMITYIMALAALRKRNSDEAVKLFKTAGDLMISLLGKDDICLVPLLIGYGKALRQASRYKDSIDQLQMALDIKKAVKEDEDEEVWSIDVDIASNLIKMEQSEKAMVLLLDTLNKAVKIISQYENVIILIKNYIARCYVDIGQTKDALVMIAGIFEETFDHEGFPTIPTVLETPEKFEVNEGADLVVVCQQMNTIIEIFTCQTLLSIYTKNKNLKSAEILKEYIHMHAIDYDIE